MPIPPHLCVQNLFVLVGGNPLPNYVAIKLLLNKKGHLFLVYTTDVADIAARLCTVAGLTLGQNATMVLVDDSSAVATREQVRRVAAGKSQIALNYTGGTKHMVLHVYRGLVDANPGETEVILSYLDARSLQLRIEQGRGDTLAFPVATVEPSFQQLLALHNRTANEYKREPLYPPIYPDLRQVRYVDLRDWWNSASHGMKERTHEITLPVSARFALLTRHWRGATTVGELAQVWNTEVSDVAKWFGDAGLEDYTLWSIAQHTHTAQLHDVGKNIKPREIEFEFDVIAMRGYQLFAISCANSTEKSVIKHKLFEAYVRARQMGGEETRVAVVCRAPANNPKNHPRLIERELAEELEAQGKIRVFGAEHIRELPQHLYTWLTTAPH